MRHEQPGQGGGDPMCIWCVTANPTDFPGLFVARLFLGEQATGHRIVTRELETLRDVMRGMGLIPIPRHPEDDPVIVETWL